MKPTGRGCPPIDLNCTENGWHARLTNTLDEKSRQFEAELSRTVTLPVPQQQIHLDASPREFRLFQLRDPQGRAAMQIAFQVYRPSRLPQLGRGIAAKLGRAINPESRRAGLRLLRKLCISCTDLITLRLQPIRFQDAELDLFEQDAADHSFRRAEAMSYTRTLKFSLEGSLEDILTAMTKRTRAKIRHRTRSEIDLIPLTDARYIPACRAAMRASFERTGGNPNEFDFEAAFALAASHPDRVRIFGMFLPSNPTELVAFVIGHHNGGDVAEYVAAGSLPNPELRKLSFNYFLVWELMQWAHAGGAKWLDLGGITPGGPNDPRASISEFKRHFSEDEIEVGREMVTTLRPVRAFLFDQLSRLRQIRKSTVVNFASGATAGAMVATLFCGC